MSFEDSIPKVETIEQRNLRILADLESGMLPVLPFELPLLEAQLESVKAEQDEMGRELGEVNHQSSETWHDNFAANQIEWHSRVVSARGRRIVDTLHRAVEHTLPPEGGQVTLGSVVELRFRDNAPPEKAILTGTVREIGSGVETGLPDDLMFVSLQSPLGLALLGAQAGQVIAYEVNGAPKSIQLLSVRQMHLPE